LALFGRRPPQRVDSLVMPASENLHRSGHSISSSAQGAPAHSGTAVLLSDSMFQSVPPNGGLESMSMSGKCRYQWRIPTRCSPTGGAMTPCGHNTLQSFINV